MFKKVCSRSESLSVLQCVCVNFLSGNPSSHYITINWDKVFKRGLSKFFKDCLPQNLLSPLLNTLSQLSLRLINTGLVSSRVSLISWGSVYLTVFGHPSSDGVSIKIPDRLDVLLHRLSLHPIFSYWVG